MQLEAQRNKSRVAEQNNRVLDIMGRNGPSSKAPAAKQAPAAVAAAAAGAAGRGLALGPSAEERCDELLGAVHLYLACFILLSAAIRLHAAVHELAGRDCLADCGTRLSC